MHITMRINDEDDRALISHSSHCFVHPSSHPLQLGFETFSYANVNREETNASMINT